MVDVAVETSAYTGFYSRVRRIGSIWTDEDTGYVILINNLNDVKYRKTTDGGATWEAAVDVGGAITAATLDVWFDKWTPGDNGTLIHIWWTEAGADDVNYRSLDTSTDTLGTLRIVFDGATFASSPTRAGAGISGTKAVGGNLYVQFWGDIDGERGFYRSVDSGATWTSRTDGADGNAVDEVLCLPDDDSSDNQDIVMIYWDRSANELSIKKYDDSDGATGTWSETSISGSMVDTTAILQMSAIVRHSNGDVIVAAWDALDSVDASLRIFEIALATPTITEKTSVVVGNGVDEGDDCAGAALFIDQNTNDLYCAYLGNEDGSETWPTALTAFYKKSEDGGDTWGSQLAYQEDVADDERYIAAGHSTPGAAAGRFEPVFFNDDLNDLLVNVNNSVEITVAPPVAIGVTAVQLTQNVVRVPDRMVLT